MLGPIKDIAIWTLLVIAVGVCLFLYRRLRHLRKKLANNSNPYLSNKSEVLVIKTSDATKEVDANKAFEKLVKRFDRQTEFFQMTIGILVIISVVLVLWKSNSLFSGVFLYLGLAMIAWFLIGVPFQWYWKRRIEHYVQFIDVERAMKFTASRHWKCDEARHLVRDVLEDALDD